MQAAGRDMEGAIESFLILAREGDTGLPDEDLDATEVLRERIDKARPAAGRASRSNCSCASRRRCGCAHRRAWFR
jgi:hypothetical protein